MLTKMGAIGMTLWVASFAIWQTAPSSSASPDAGTDMALAEPFETLFCGDCFDCGLNDHFYAHIVPLGIYEEHGDHPCQCCSCGGHQQCSEEQDDADGDGVEAQEARLTEAFEVGSIAEQLRVALLSENTTLLTAVVAEHAGRVEISGPRQAVQVIGCADQVVAQFPLDDVRMAALVEEQ